MIFGCPQVTSWEPFWAPFGHQKRKSSAKNMKKWVPGSGLEKQQKKTPYQTRLERPETSSDR